MLSDDFKRKCKATVLTFFKFYNDMIPKLSSGNEL